MLQNAHFQGKILELTQSYKMRDQYDNCYREAKPLQAYEFRRCETVSRTVQTNVLELLAIEELLPGILARVAKKREMMGGVEALDRDEIDENDAREVAILLLSEGIFDKVLGQLEGFQDERQRDMLPANRIRDLPHFDIDELIGRFDLDDEGNFKILKTPGSPGPTTLIDLDDLAVNEQGYLINKGGDVITRGGRIIFKVNELEKDGKIPKKKKKYAGRWNPALQERDF